MPKYAIDVYLSETLQAYYNFIFMPVFAIGLLASFLFNPILASLGMSWQEKDFKTIEKKLFKQILVILSITIISIIAAFFIGIPILSWLYATELSEYKFELCILIFGGGLMALSGLFTAIITIIRKQKILLIVYLVTAVLAKLISSFFVSEYEIMGASLLYTVLMTTLTISFIIILLIFKIKTEKIDKKNNYK